MLYLLGGASRSGKSKITHLFLKQRGISYFSIDYLKMGFHNGIPKLGVNAEESSYVVAEKMWPYVKALLINIIEVGDNFIIEGDSLDPKYVNELLQDEKYNSSVRVCFIGYPNTTPEKKLYEIRTFGSEINNWIASRSDEYILDRIKNEIERSKKLEKECDELNMHFVDISTDFEIHIQDVIDYFISPSKS